MRLPRVRLTIRKIMVVVAAVAVILAGPPHIISSVE
jgi:hypothetical protein